MSTLITACTGLLRYAEAAAFGHAKAADALLSGLTLWLNSKNPESPVASWPYTIAERIASLSAILVWIRQSKIEEAVSACRSG